MEPATFDIAKLLGEVLPTAGVGGALALAMFYFYRADRRDNAERFEEMTMRYDALVARHEKATEGWMQIVKDNTSAMIMLSERIRKP